MHYMTRHLEALTDIPLGSSLHRQGDEFFCTVIDADYLVSRGKAREVVSGAESAPVAITPTARETRAAPPQAVAAPVAIDEPKAAEVSPTEAAPAADSPAPVAAATEDQESGQPAPAPTPRRRTARQGSEPQADSAAAAAGGENSAG